MGIGKCIEALGCYAFYTSDVEAFLQELSRRYAVNIEVLASGYSRIPVSLPEEGLRDFGFEKSIRVGVDCFDADEANPTPESVYITYEAWFPVQIGFEEELFIEFNPNHLFTLGYLPLGSTWRGFIGALTGACDPYYHSHQAVIDHIKEIRKGYSALLAPMGHGRLMIHTDGNYAFEYELLNKYQKGQAFSFDEALTAAQRLDGVQVFELDSLLQPAPDPRLKRYHEQEKDFDVVVVDRY